MSRRAKAIAKRVVAKLPGGTQRAVRGVGRRVVAQMQAKNTYATAYLHVRAILMGESTETLGPPGRTAPTWSSTEPDRVLARRVVRRSTLAEQLELGLPLEDAVAALVRTHLAGGERGPARSLAQALQRQPSTQVAGYLGSALIAVGYKLPHLAWASFSQVPTAVWRRLAGEEYFRTGFVIERGTAIAQARALIADRPADMPPAAWIGIVKRAFGAGEEQLAEELFGVAESLATADPDGWRDTVVERDWLRPWFGRAVRPAPAATVPAGHIAFAVLDYKQPDLAYASSNIGDYVQTLAAMGHLVRHQNLRLHSDDDGLATVATELQQRVRPELRLATPGRDVTLVTVNRDATNYDSIPENTWTVLFGWHMHPMFDRYDFPPHPNLRPIIISFHCNRPALLTPAAIEYLRTYGPVGCRDWSTVDLLLSVGVPAFFSGCLTTTINTVFPALPAEARPPRGAPTAYVDVTPIADTPTIEHLSEQSRDASLVQNIRDAVQRLEDYRRRYAKVVTSRLHCYLPCTSIGAAVEFQPSNGADVRFNGLYETTDPAYFEAMRTGIMAKLETTLAAIVAGRSEAEVYQTWRDAVADDVATALARHRAAAPTPPPSFDINAVCATLRANATTIERSVITGDGPEVHVALALDRNLKEELRVVVAAMADNSSRPLHLWILCRDHDHRDYTTVAALFPEITVTWLPCDTIDYGNVGGMLRHITISTMDRLLLPELLPDLDRIVYHDIDALPLGDVARLYDWDLGGHALAARSSIGLDVCSGFGTIMRAATWLRQDPARFYELLRRMYSRHSYDFAAYNAGILVLDLARMRADNFCHEFIALVEQYGMNDQLILNCYTGPHRAELPPQWNCWPTQDIVSDDVQIIHWAGGMKPWDQPYVLHQDTWNTYVQRVRERAATHRTTLPAPRDTQPQTVPARD